MKTLKQEWKEAIRNPWYITAWIILIIFTFLSFGCGSPNCPESEKVVDHYETETSNGSTTTTPIMKCPTN